MKKVIALLALIAIVGTYGFGEVKVEPLQFSLSATFVGFSIADVALSIHGIKYHGLYETNKLLAPLFEREDYLPLWGIEAAGTAFILLACHILIVQKDKTTKFLGYACLIGACVARGLIVSHNIRLNARTQR